MLLFRVATYIAKAQAKGGQRLPRTNRRVFFLNSVSSQAIVGLST